MFTPSALICSSCSSLQLMSVTDGLPTMPTKYWYPPCAALTLAVSAEKEFVVDKTARTIAVSPVLASSRCRNNVVSGVFVVVIVMLEGC